MHGQAMASYWSAFIHHAEEGFRGREAQSGSVIVPP
jgi:hypothetical protein